jgi:hypothetical protein
VSLKPPPLAVPFDVQGQPSREWVSWVQDAFTYIAKNQGYNTTSNRPINGMRTGDVFFDTTIGKPIWYTGSGWVDATGSAV